MSELHITSRPPRQQGPAAGETALLVHGTMDRATSFTRMAQRLADWTILTYDRRGYAASAGRPPSGDFADQIDDLLEVVDGYGPTGRDRIVAFGHSLGGDVVLAAAGQRPDLFAAIAVYETPASWEPWWTVGRPQPDWDRDDPAQLAEGFMRRVIGDRIWDRLPERARIQRRAEGGAMVAEITALAKGRPFDPNDIALPVIVARGALAGARHVRASAELAAGIPGAQLVVVEGADHGAHLSHPAEMAGLVNQALARAHEAIG